MNDSRWFLVCPDATESGLSYYDASYVWLAYKRGLILRTRDKKVLKKFPDLARAMPT